MSLEEKITLLGTRQWVVTPGNYEIQVGSSSQQIALKGLIKKNNQ